MTFAEIKENIRANLDDAGVTFYSTDDLIESLSDAYDDVAFLSKCIIKKTQLNFKTGPYYDFSMFIPDFLQVTAIFNNNTNRWLNDSFSTRDFDKMRNNWELWAGTPEFWSPADIKMNVILPYYSSLPAAGMDIYYNATAPFVVDSDTPLIATDMQKLLEWYCTGDLLEQAEEFTKAGPYWAKYFLNIDTYKERVQNIAKRDLLVLI